MFIRMLLSGVPDQVLCAAQRRMRLRTDRCPSEMRRGKAGRRRAKLTRAPRVAENAAETGTKNATRFVSSELLGRYRENGSGRHLDRQSWDNHSL
jgi:hypothetical protein